MRTILRTILPAWSGSSRVASASRAASPRLPQRAPASPPPAAFFNRKHVAPSELMRPSDGKRYRCPWIEGCLSIHSDGNVTCGLDDPHGRRSFGNINRQSLAVIWANPEYERLQRKMWDGHRCTECNLAYPVEPTPAEPMPARLPHPNTLIVEPTVRCNLRCPQPSCVPNNDRAIRTRDSDFLDVESFRRVADDLAGKLDRIYFYNYGDPFFHGDAETMLAHLQRTNPDAWVHTSTNGIPLAKLDRARKVVAAGALDFMVFTISGMTQQSYNRYHVGGRLDLALRGMTNVLQAKRELGVTRPIVHWRYLMFNWNDSEADIDAALRLAEEHGVDEFRLHLTHVPPGALSLRFSPGTPNFLRYRKHIDNAFGYTGDSPMPDKDGFYRLEQNSRWTSWQARKRLRVQGNRARLAVSTNRPAARERTSYTFIVTPWQKVKVPLEVGGWRAIELVVPDELQLETIEVEIVTFEHWFPAEECGTPDWRCLGVLVLEDDALLNALPIWRDCAALDATDTARLAAFRFQEPEPLVDW